MILYFSGWHRRFNSKAGGSKLHFYRLVSALRKEADSVSLTVRLVEEQSLARFQRQTYKSAARLVTLMDRLDDKTLKTSDFLREVGSMYAQSVPNPADLPESDSDTD